MSVDLYEATLQPADLAWAADRLTYSALDADQRAMFDRLAEYVEETMSSDGYHEGCEPAGTADDVREERDELEQEVAEALEVIGGDIAEGEPLGKALERHLARAREEGMKDAMVPSRENATTKGKRLLIEGRLTVLKHTEDGLIVASCRGDSGEVYALGYRPDQRRWGCTCQAGKTGTKCSHLHALQLITVRATA